MGVHELEPRSLMESPAPARSRPNGVEVSFEIDPFRKQCLLEGLDDIGLTLEKGGSIDSFEATRAEEKPWL